MSRRQESFLCDKIKKSMDLRELEDKKRIGNSHLTIYSRMGCLSCSGGREMPDRCIHYTVEKSRPKYINDVLDRAYAEGPDRGTGEGSEQ